MGKLKQHLKHAFGMDPPDSQPLPELPAPLRRFARAIVDRGMETPAVLFLETVRPLNFLAGQTMRAAGPLVQLGIHAEDYRLIARALERRHTIPALISLIEELVDARGAAR